MIRVKKSQHKATIDSNSECLGKYCTGAASAHQIKHNFSEYFCVGEVWEQIVYITWLSQENKQIFHIKWMLKYLKWSEIPT